jgi:glycosyltransferase involved in cell wall biosynthesis
MTAPIPKVSIGLPVYNGEKYLRLALDSILQQDYTDFELIISDNASTDATQNICREYAAKDSRIRYYRNETNTGATANFNCLVKLARGKFFKWAAHDDVHLPEFLRRCVEVIEQAPATVALVTPKAEIIDEHGKIVNILVESLDTRSPRPHQRVGDVLRRVFWAPAQFGLFRADALRKTRLMQPFAATDYVLLVEVALMSEIWELPETLFQRRIHPDISTTANKKSRDLLVWLDPSQRRIRNFVPPTLRLGLEFFRTIMRAKLSLRERFLCYWTVFMVWSPREYQKYRNKIAIRTRLKKFFNGCTENRCGGPAS